MKTLGNMIDIFTLQKGVDEELWKFIHILLEIILKKANERMTEDENAIYMVSGALHMISKLWLRCPKILRENTILLNFFWHFIKQQGIKEDDKAAILHIYYGFLLDLNKKSSEGNSDINLGDFIDVLKINIGENLLIIFSRNIGLRRICFKVIHQCYLQGFIPYNQAAEFFLICLNDSITELEPETGEKFNEASLMILRDICKKDARILFKLELHRVSISFKII